MQEVQAARIIVIAAAFVQNAAGALLLVRKRATDCFMLPGGKIEPGETPLQALARELRFSPNSCRSVFLDLVTVSHGGSHSNPDPLWQVAGVDYEPLAVALLSVAIHN